MKVHYRRATDGAALVLPGTLPALEASALGPRVVDEGQSECRGDAGRNMRPTQACARLPYIAMVSVSIPSPLQVAGPLKSRVLEVSAQRKEGACWLMLPRSQV